MNETTITRDSVLTLDELADAIVAVGVDVDDLDLRYVMFGKDMRFIWGQVRDLSHWHLPRREPSPGKHLYFIRNPTSGLIKIGVAKNVKKRLNQLGCACGVELELLRLIEGHGALETEFHVAFGEHRTVGEWFKPDPELVAFATGNDVPVVALVRRAVYWAKKAREK